MGDAREDSTFTSRVPLKCVLLGARKICKLSDDLNDKEKTFLLHCLIIAITQGLLENS